VPVFDGSMPRGIYSGDMMDGMPVPTIIVHVPGQGTCLYTAEDDELIRWKPHPKNPVIPIAGAPPEATIFDPTGWKDGDTYYALVGNKNKTPGYEGDTTSLFRSRDLEHWEYRGPFYKSERRWTADYMDCACPDFFPIGDRHMLISHVHQPWNHLQYYIGRYDRAAERFLPEQHGFMSWPGGSLCAPETMLDDQGRRLFWGWIMEADGARKPEWASVATLPRVLSLGPDRSLRIRPAPELEILRTNPRQRDNLTVTNELVLDDIRGDCLELDLVIAPGDAKEFGLVVRQSPDRAEQTPIVISPSAQTLRTELARASLDPKIRYSAMNANFARERNIPTEKRFATEQVAPFALGPGEPVHLRVFLDRSVLEVFANDRQCLTQRLYPTRADSLGVSLFARGGSVKVISLRAWDVSPTNSW
jgi:sucrose-6-phosphate hydrolase SacC (GH32 family)